MRNITWTEEELRWFIFRVYPLYAGAAGFSAQKCEPGPDPKNPHSPLGLTKKRGAREVVQPFSRGLAKSAALQWQSFMAALFHLQKSNCGISAQVILPVVAPSHAFNLWLICGPRPLLRSQTQPGFSSRNPARARPNASRRKRTPCSLDLWPQCLVLSCVWLSIFFFHVPPLFSPPPLPLSFLFFVHPKIAPPL